MAIKRCDKPADATKTEVKQNVPRRERVMFTVPHGWSAKDVYNLLTKAGYGGYGKRLEWFEKTLRDLAEAVNFPIPNREDDRGVAPRGRPPKTQQD